MLVTGTVWNNSKYTRQRRKNNWINGKIWNWSPMNSCNALSDYTVDKKRKVKGTAHTSFIRTRTTILVQSSIVLLLTTWPKISLPASISLANISFFAFGT